MKFVSPFQRGQHVHVQVAGHAGARGPADVDADVDAVGRVRGPDRAQRARLRRAHERGGLVVVEVLELGDVAHGATIRWPEPYG